MKPGDKIMAYRSKMKKEEVKETKKEQKKEGKKGEMKEMKQIVKPNPFAKKKKRNIVAI